VTFGEIRLQLEKLCPGIDQELIDGWINARYTEILDSLPWKRAESESVFQIPASYNIGTVAVSQGSANVSGTGTTWTEAMNGRYIRINSGTEYYLFTWVSATSATLDRPYEGSTSSITGSAIGAAGSGYAPGDLFYIEGGNGLAWGTVLTVSAGGGVTGYAIDNSGNNYSTGVANTTTNNNGVGFTLNITSVGGSSGLSYRIDQAVFAAPDGARIIRSVKPMHGYRPLDMITPAELNRRGSNRSEYGIPRMAAATWDNNVDPPSLQIELYPIPTSPDSVGNTLSFAVDYVWDVEWLSPSDTQTSLLPWARPQAIFEGVQASVDRWQASKQPGQAGALIGAATAHESKFSQLLKVMAQNNALQRGPQPMQLADHLKRQVPGFYCRGPWHRGYTG
jgi:hypothetical protein